MYKKIHSLFPVFIKERPSSSIDFLNKYRVTKVGVTQFVWNKLYIIVVSVDTSPYAQTGFSIWDLIRIYPKEGEEGEERFVVIHDIERMSPLICDVITLSP